jgi:hypothetical protein
MLRYAMFYLVRLQRYTAQVVPTMHSHLYFRIIRISFDTPADELYQSSARISKRPTFSLTHHSKRLVVSSQRALSGPGTAYLQSQVTAFAIHCLHPTFRAQNPHL